jgi:hypothetical protein
MQKLKFGIQLSLLMLSFPLYFLTEMKKADEDLKRKQPKQQQQPDVKKAGAAIKKMSPVAELTLIPGSVGLFVNT